MNKILMFIFGVMLLGCGQKEYSAKIEFVNDFRSKYVDSRGLEIWFPAEYFAHPGQRFRVLYMHDGQNIFSRNTFGGGKGWYADSIANAMIKSGEIDPFIIVGVYNNRAKRFIEYMPQKPLMGAIEKVRDAVGEKRGLIDMDTMLLADKYLRFLVEELKPYIDGAYRTLPESQYTAICGSSMGGLISMYAMCEYPDVFGQAACLSTHWPIVGDNSDMKISQTVRDYMIEKLPNAGRNRIYFDYGTASLDELYEVHQLKVDTIAINKGYKKGKDTQTLKFEGAPHNESAWAARFDQILNFLYKKQ